MYGYSLGIKKAPSGGGGGAIAPSNLTAPVISGTTTLGSTLTTTDGTWSGTPTPTFTYQWYRGASPISGATSTTYVTTLADSTANITCQVTATNSAGSATATSNTITLQSYAPVNTVAPVISGTAVVGQTLTTTNGTWTNSPSSYSYQWKRGATNIGTNSSSYTLDQADAGNTSNITCVVTATNSAGSANATSNQIAQILTVRTNAFMVASGISDSTIRGGLNTFDIGLISNSLDTKMKAVYPFVGGTASTHRWNFMNAADTNAAFRLTFSGSWVHSSTGAKPNGTNAFANTFLNTSTALGANNAHLSYYTRTNSAYINELVLGNLNDINGSNGLNLAVRRSANQSSFRATEAAGASGLVDSTSTDSRGLTTGSIISSNSRKIYKNTTLLATTTTNVNWSAANNNVYLGAALAINSGNTVSYTDKESSFASIGDGLTDTDVTNLYNLTQALQTTLGRQV